MAEPLTHYVSTGWRQGLNPHPLFETNYFLNANELDPRSIDDPLSYFFQRSSDVQLKTSPFFDPRWYNDKNPDVPQVGVAALIHYLTDGFVEGRQPAAFFECDLNDLTDDPKGYTTDDPLSQKLLAGIIGHDRLPFGFKYSANRGIFQDARVVSTLSGRPLVSIIIANMNGDRFLDRLFESLSRQTYENFEIIMVDDGSTDSSLQIAAKANVAVLQSEERLGFASANNLGLSRAKGELICLLNNDTRVADEWLENLVTTMSQNSAIGAVTSKIRFMERFVNLRILASAPFEIALHDVLPDLGYEKFFVRWGVNAKNLIVASDAFGHEQHCVEIDLTFNFRGYKIPMAGDDIDETTLKVFINGTQTPTVTEKKSSDVLLVYVDRHAPALTICRPFFIINNAGSITDRSGKPVDRGFGEVERNQFNIQADVDFICGCSALVRREALRGMTLFIDEFFAYFEDSELSHRIRKNGYRIVYEPTSIVYHHHSATTVEKSPFWWRQTARNEILFKYLRDDKNRFAQLQDDLSHLNHLKVYFSSDANASEREKSFAAEIPVIVEEIYHVVDLIDRRLVPRPASPRVGIYNPYWSTNGGGEAHALQIARALSQAHMVELISIYDFDLDALCRYFNIESQRFIKRIVKEMNCAVTEDYDIYINSCFHSSHRSAAKRSFYIVSFPHAITDRSFLGDYLFLANSHFTAHWIGERWGDVRQSVLRPVVMPALVFKEASKERVILSVGRFVSSGHTKRQLEIARAFRKLTQRSAAARGWQLVLIGSVNDERYLDAVKEELCGVDSLVLPNASFEEVADAYKRAAIYVHACGLNTDIEQPELQEHFGMAVAQAVCSGCFPLVYPGAGPSEIIEDMNVGSTFLSEDELVDKLEDTMELFESARLHESGDIAGRAERIFGWDAFSEAVRLLVDGTEA